MMNKEVATLSNSESNSEESAMAYIRAAMDNLHLQN